ncbi:hypothetical protein MES4922_300057 [Mesorhizobium ventifaucium]|uniref:Uncharacterized protein n=1 Tax=Mesorhizobium ventifaucium TaxID=666020 RepID=A0ABN8K0F9_9HYPH|nr:hypothetical protein MES4922_300057 [Mesorhizobium ventifaucium]
MRWVGRISGTSARDAWIGRIGLQTFATYESGSGVEPRVSGVRNFDLKWLPGLIETANYELPIPLETTPQPTIKIRKRDRERAERTRLAGGPKPALRARCRTRTRKG